MIPSPLMSMPRAAAPSRAFCNSTLVLLRRSLSTNVTASAADRRLAGLRRFYKNVGIKPTSAPSVPHIGAQQNEQRTDVESPISAGVDGSQSATGVGVTIPNPSRWSSLLNTTPTSSWHTVTLDGRAIRTPLGLPLTLPSSTLALAIASEWDAQRKYLQPAQMPLMTLCCTAIDQVAADPTAHQSDVMRYLANDTSCYWADPNEDRALHRRQSQAWEGLHNSLSTDLLQLPNDLGPAHAMGGGEAILLSRKSNGNPRSGLPHPPILVERAREWVNSLDAWSLAALYSACAESKSFFIGAALIHDAIKARGNALSEVEGDEKSIGDVGNSGSIVRDGKWAVGASRVEEEFNIECWGLVEGGHDYDRLNCSIQMHAASFLARTVV